MAFGFENLGMLLALGAVAVPVLIHWLLRRKSQVVDWGAMQFLQVSKAVRRRWWLEELLLLGVRMGLVALLVLALAGPFARGPLVSALAEQPPRDIVVIMDASASMGVTDGRQLTPFAQAGAWVQGLVGQLRPDDRVALLLARQPPQWLAADLGSDRDLLLDRLATVPAPAGNADWPAALQAARRLLVKQGRSERGHIYLVRDRQRHGWADDDTLAAFKVQMPSLNDKNPQLELVEFQTTVPEGGIPNAWLAPVQAGRALAWPGQPVRFSSTMHLPKTLSGFPWKLQVERDGQPVETLPVPSPEALASGQAPVQFHLRFDKPGVHLVSLALVDQKKQSFPPPDWLPADNRQSLAVEVVQDLPVLLVSGDDKPGAQSSAYFLEKALAPVAGAPSPLRPRQVNWRELRPQDLIGASGILPQRVVILADVPRLETDVVKAMDGFLEAGGSVLVVLGPRAHQGRDLYDRLLERQGQGWLPVHLVQVQEKTPLAPAPARPDVRSFQHPALAVFRQDARGAMDQVSFEKWWMLTPAPQAVTMARLTTGEPWLVERPWKKGRVLVCATPLDRSWDSTFPAAWEYPVFVHEMVAYLAGISAAPLNLGQGQSFRWQPRDPHNWPAGPWPTVVHFPGGNLKSMSLASWPWTMEMMRDPGAYKLSVLKGSVPEEETTYFTVRADPRESDLTSCTKEDDTIAARTLGLTPGPGDSGADQADGLPPVDMWWLFFFGVLAFLALEVALTRRIAVRQGGA